MKFNIIGFSNSSPKEYKHCVIHAGVRLIQALDDPDKLFCPTCGMSYLPKDTASEDQYVSRFGPQQTKIISPKKQKKYYSQDGNEITDPDLIAEIHKGAHVISYHEFMPENINSETNTRAKTMARKRD